MSFHKQTFHQFTPVDRFVFYDTEGHGYLRVRKELLDGLGLTDKISRYSYTDPKRFWVYLEEDYDLGIFLKKLDKKSLEELNYTTKYVKSDYFDVEGLNYPFLKQTFHKDTFHQSFEVKEMIKQINQYPPKESLRLFTALNAKDIVYQDRKGDKDAFVQFKVTGDKSPKINKVRVIYDYGMDLYNIEFWYIRGTQHKIVKKINGLYNDQLTETIWRNVVIV